MLELTFGEQVKIVLRRKGMTIKELAELIEARTGKKMSRQNLTQRLSRDRRDPGVSAASEHPGGEYFFPASPG